MNIKFRAIDKTNYNECIDLKVDKNQSKYVAPNIYSLVQATYESDLFPLGIYLDDKMVGFILYDFDYDLNGWSMSRFMIDEIFQNQGIGKIALERFLEFFKNKYGHLRMYTSAEVDNLVAIKLYESFGFKRVKEFEYEVKGVVYKEVRMYLNNDFKYK